MYKKLEDFSGFRLTTEPDLGPYDVAKMRQVKKQSKKSPKEAKWYSATYNGNTPPSAKGLVFDIYCALDEEDLPTGKLCDAPNPPFTTDDTADEIPKKK